MKRRPRTPRLALAAALMFAGCVTDSAADDPAIDDSVIGDGGVDDETAHTGDDTLDDGPAPVDRQPALPPLHPHIDDWDETVVSIATGDGITTTVDAKVAATPDERQRGLMEVEELPEGSGMLFLFENERTGGFWMYNTLVPLDIAYIDTNGVIGTILAMDPCPESTASECPTYAPEEPYVTALEVPQGWFAQSGIAEGDPVVWTSPQDSS